MFRFILTVAISGISLFAISQTPFEKKGKWGLKDNYNKVILKPAYNSITAVPEANVFVVSKYLGTEYEGKALRYGVINESGTEIIPVKADSITFLNESVIAHTKTYTPLNDDRVLVYPYTELYTLSGQKLQGLEGYVKNFYPGGVLFVALEIRIFPHAGKHPDSISSTINSIGFWIFRLSWKLKALHTLW